VVPVVVNPNPTPSITPNGPTTFCSGGNVILDAGAGYSGYAWSNGGNTQTISVAASGNYSVTVTDGNGCQGTAGPVAVTVNTSPTPPVINASGPLTFCDYEFVTLTSSYANNILWSNGLTTQTIVVNTSGTYTVTYTDANGCSSVSLPVVVSVYPSPSPVITANGPTTICSGDTVVLDAGAGYTNYAWSNGANSQTIIVTASGAFDVTVTNANGCVGTSAIETVVVNASPSPVITASGPLTFCDGDSVTLDAGSGYSSYAWSNGGSTQAIVANLSGNYTVTVTNASGCEGISSPVPVTVNNNPSPVITPAGPVAICNGDTVILDAGAGYAAYLWSPNGETTQTIFVTSAGTYSVHVTDGNGCSGGSANTTITLNPGPGAAFTQSGGGNIITFTDGSTGNPVSWAWDFGDGGTSTSQNPTHTYSTAGNFTVCLTVTDINGCTDVQCETVTISTAIISPLLSGFDLGVSPNPGSGQFEFFMHVPSTVAFTMKIYNQLGVLVLEQAEKKASGEYRQTLNLSEFSDGVYNLVVEMKEGVLTYKIVLQK
jgi:hypothetical protein